MIDSTYYEWFRLQTPLVVDLTWCSATKIDDVLAVYGISPESTQPGQGWDEWKELLRLAEVDKDARVHDARHTAATLLIEQGVDISVV